MNHSKGKKFLRAVLFLAVALVSSLSVLACGWLELWSTDSTASATYVFLPQGDRITVGKDAFIVKDSGGAFQYEGSVSSMDNRFYKLTVERTNLPQNIPVNTIFFVLPIEGTLLAMFSGYSAVQGATYATFMEIRKPLSVDGVCPSSPVTYVGRMRPNTNLTRTTFLYGQGRISQGSGTLLQFERKMVPLTEDFSAPPEYSVLLSGFQPSGSSAAHPSGATMYFSPSGTALVKTGDTSTDTAYYLLPVSGTGGTSPTATEITANGIEYRGWVEFPSPDNASKLAQPIAFRGNGANLIGGPYTKFGLNEVDATRTITISKSENAPAGVFDLSLNSREGYPTQTRKIVATKVSGRIILLGAGDRDGNNDGDFDDPGDWLTSFLVQMKP